MTLINKENIILSIVNVNFIPFRQGCWKQLRWVRNLEGVFYSIHLEKITVSSKN